MPDGKEPSGVPQHTVVELEEEHILDDQTPEYILAHREEFLAILESAGVEITGDIDEIRPELAQTHGNRVLMAEIPYSRELLPQNTGSNQVKFFEILYQDKPILAVFKPLSGESQRRLSEFQIAQMYTRARAAYLVDYFMDLGVVPPTVLKDIDGETGSLQLYISHTTAKSPNVDRGLAQAQDFSGLDWKKIAILDALIGNRDRNNGNYLVCSSDPSRFFAIDHGCSFCPGHRGDQSIAYNHFVENHEQAGLDDDLRAKLQTLLDKEEELMATLPPQINGYIEYQRESGVPTLFDRARLMLDKDTILAEEEE